MVLQNRAVLCLNAHLLCVREPAHFARTLLWRNNHTKLGTLFAMYQKFCQAAWMHSAGLTKFFQFYEIVMYLFALDVWFG